MTEETNLENTVHSQAVAEIALKAIRSRSYSGRHPELGKMINCPHCRSRHREHERKCEQKFATGRYDLRNPKPLLIAGITPETETVVEARKIRAMFGTTMFKGKRRKPPLNRRANHFVQLVRELLPDEYTEEDLKIARTKARRRLANRYGRHGFLPPIWQKRKNEEVVPEAS